MLWVSNFLPHVNAALSIQNEVQRKLYFVILSPLTNAICQVTKCHGSLVTTHVFYPGSPKFDPHSRSLLPTDVLVIFIGTYEGQCTGNGP